MKGKIRMKIIINTDERPIDMDMKSWLENIVEMIDDLSERYPNIINTDDVEIRVQS